MNGAKTMAELIGSNRYPGRGILMGRAEGGARAVAAYFIMGRSENSRNRVFVKEGGALRTQPFDAQKLDDPSLVIYTAARQVGDRLIITNGDHTDTIASHLASGGSFETALRTRRYEPDAPIFTPRISGMMDFSGGDFTYKLSILKCADPEAGLVGRYFYEYSRSVTGTGHLIHTYQGDGDPAPSFCGEPRRVRVPKDIDAFADEAWEQLDADNRVALFVVYVDPWSGAYQTRIVNKHHQGGTYGA